MRVAPLSAEIARLEHVLRFSRENAIVKGSAVTVDARALCDRLTPSSPLVRFFPDGTADPFVATTEAGRGPVCVEVEAGGRIRGRRDGSIARFLLEKLFPRLPNVSSEEARAALTLLCRDLRRAGAGKPVSYRLKTSSDGKRELWRDEEGRRAFLTGNIAAFEARTYAGLPRMFLFRIVTSEQGEHHEAVAVATAATFSDPLILPMAMEPLSME